MQQIRRCSHEEEKNSLFDVAVCCKLLSDYDKGDTDENYK